MLFVFRHPTSVDVVLR